MGCVSSKPAVLDGSKVLKEHHKELDKDGAKVTPKPLFNEVTS